MRKYIFYVYFLTNKYNNVLYIGVTNNLKRRIAEHKNKVFKGFTRDYNVTKLVYYEVFTDINLAIAREKQLKGWLRSKKNALVEKVNPKWEELFGELE
jgi:putative endonuclease